MKLRISFSPPPILQGAFNLTVGKVIGFGFVVLPAFVYPVSFISIPSILCGPVTQTGSSSITPCSAEISVGYHIT